MTTQLSLLADQPVSQVRRRDPRTARVAAARNPGGRASQAARILRFVWDHGTITADQAHRLNEVGEDTPRGEWATRIGVLCSDKRGRLLEKAGEVEEADRHGRVRTVLRYRLTDAGHAECARMPSSDMVGVNTHDVEDCDRCADLDEWCGYHQGEASGGGQMLDLIRRGIDDPEWLHGALTERDRKRAEHAARSAISGGSST